MTTITVAGTISDWLWNGSQYYQGSLIDIGLFAPAGTSLSGMPIQVLWNSDPFTAAITINGTTITLGGPSYFQFVTYPSTTIQPTYQNITLANFNPFNDLPGNIAIDSFDPVYATLNNPHGLGGAFGLIGPSASCNQYSGGNVGPTCQMTLDGYYYVTSMVVPGPVVGEGLIPLLLLAILMCKLRIFRLTTKANYV